MRGHVPAFIHRVPGHLVARAIDMQNQAPIDPTGLRPAPQAEPVRAPPHDSHARIDPDGVPHSIIAYIVVCVVLGAGAQLSALAMGGTHVAVALIFLAVPVAVLAIGSRSRGDRARRASLPGARVLE
jgi:hypothetical protein